MILLTFLLAGVGVIATTKPERPEVYKETELAKKTEVDILFAHNNNTDYKRKVQLQRLHVKEDFVGIDKELSFSMIESYKEELGTIYENNHPVDYVEVDTIDIELVEEIKDSSYCLENDKAVSFLEEYRDNDTVYRNKKSAAALYQSGRAVKDVLEVSGDRNLELDEIFYLASEAVSREEKFLQYKDRNINPGSESIILQVEDIAFMNGKIYYRLAKFCMGNQGEKEQYVNSFFSLAYVCMQKSQEEMSIRENHKDYAIVEYYLGNIGELMVGRVKRDGDIYGWLLEKSKQHYEKANDLIQNGSGFYREEKNMRKNIQKGLETLESIEGSG